MDSLGIHIVKLAIDICSQIFCLNTLPFVTVETNSVQSIPDLFWSKLTVLTKGVQAYDMLDLLHRESFGFDLWPIAIITLVLLIISFTLFLSFAFSLFMLESSRLLIFQALTDSQCITDSVIEGFYTQA